MRISEFGSVFASLRRDKVRNWGGGVFPASLRLRRRQVGAVEESTKVTIIPLISNCRGSWVGGRGNRKPRGGTRPTGQDGTIVSIVSIVAVISIKITDE